MQQRLDAFIVSTPFCRPNGLRLTAASQRLQANRAGAFRHRLRSFVRSALAALPTPWRHGLFRRLVDCNPPRDDAFHLKIAETQAELEACFALLHDAYVASGFMRPHPSGLRATPYHALPTTTTLCAKIGDRVVGTLSIVREGVFGFPMQSAFDITAVRAKEGRIAEISALAVHPDYRKTGGTILFPLMKFMYEYCTRYFDTRHLVIAVHPNKIELYQSLLFFQLLPAQMVDRYDFANGAPAVGATLDLHEAPTLFERAYARRPHRRNLYRFFVETRMEQIRYPARPWHTSNDPILTPAIADHFFNQRTQGFALLDDRDKRLLHSIYQGPDWTAVLPPSTQVDVGLRRHPRYSMKCPAQLTRLGGVGSVVARESLTVLEVSIHGFSALSRLAAAEGDRFEVSAELGSGLQTRVQAVATRSPAKESEAWGFHVAEPDEAWLHCVSWLERAA